MEMKKKRDRLQEIYVREALCEDAFATWVSEQGVEGVLDALGELLWWLDGIASCRWGCRGGDHEEEHLLGRISANASAALLLLKRGYVDQGSGMFRQLAETTNLLDLFTHSSKDYQDWRRSDEGVRKNRYSAFNVRLKLEKSGVGPVMGEDAYQLLSKYGTHPGPGTEPRPHDSPEEPNGWGSLSARRKLFLRCRGSERGRQSFDFRWRYRPSGQREAGRSQCCYFG